ncbi:MAG: RtcB family protein [Desulfarculus sp.]|nr:RtcB family protein [Pseudomonadota bacterium]MBV1718367.1 RtcB family protein [Desulfarculus sp.]MBU4574529.1 RtcB family protein [Pseudomonadota bacterium]MBU4599729.1 RtcB family protein [Pseudomonadota bacterium]MBV1737010.1 RtcB family protein [Desulfarculus sp.]
MSKLNKIDDYRWQLPQEGEMRCPAVVYADAELIRALEGDGTLKQLRGVASLPGIEGPALAMPDAHQGYGFPIGGVGAFDPIEGIVSPGGVGYDINCGVRLLRSKLVADDIGEARLTALADALAASVPAGVGMGGAHQLSDKELNQILAQGAAWAVGRGQGSASDLEFCEAEGALPGADPAAVSARALQRGRGQAGSLGAGNHFIELAVVEEIYDPRAAEAFGLSQGMLVLWLHSGSRGLGHQVCDDYLKRLAKDQGALRPPDRQLIAAPPASPVGRDYMAAMAAAANFAFNNRQLLSQACREVLGRVLGLGPAALGLGLVYDVAHNVAKREKHQVGGKQKELIVHRKGATRALGPGHPELPARYQGVGQPVLIPGDMGTASYVCLGTAKAMAETFASAAHGAGRAMSRTQAKKAARGRDLRAELAARRVVVRAASGKTLAEEMPEAYKDVDQVVRVMHGAGIATLVAKTRPLAVVKG